MPNQVNPPLPHKTREHARVLRTDATDAERKLWYYLRAGRLQGLKFRRQHPFPPYIVDFYCTEAQLIVELDGSQHSETADATRTHILERGGMRVLRFWDNAVLDRTEDVLNAILCIAAARTLTPTPLPMGEGLQEPTA